MVQILIQMSERDTFGNPAKGERGRALVRSSADFWSRHTLGRWSPAGPQPILTFTTVAPKGPSTDPPRPIGSANIQGHVQIRTGNHISRL